MCVMIIEQIAPPPEDAELHDRYLDVLWTRLLNQDKTLSELADLHDITKNAYWGLLRRALAYADSYG